MCTIYHCVVNLNAINYCSRVFCVDSASNDTSICKFRVFKVKTMFTLQVQPSIEVIGILHPLYVCKTVTLL